VESIRIQLLGNFPDGLSTLPQFCSAVQQWLEITEMFVPANGTNDLMLTFIATGPVNSHRHYFTITTSLDDDPLYQATHDLLAINVGRARSIPQGRNVGRQSENARPFLSIQTRWRVALKTVVLFLDLLTLDKQFFPTFLQRGCDEAICGIDCLIATLRQVRIVVHPLEPLLPVLVQAPAFLFDVRMGLDAQFHCRRFERAQNLLSDQGIDRSRRQRGTTCFGGLEIAAAASVLSFPVTMVEGVHSSATVTAKQYARQKRNSSARSALGIEFIPVLFHSFQILQIPFPRDVCGQTIFVQDLPLFDGRRRSSSTTPARKSSLWIVRPTAKGIGSRVDRMT
jgi:hypothetical protein